VNLENNGVKVYGFVSKPYDARNDKSQQALFVNRRWVRNEELTKVIYEAYHSLLFVNKHPIFVLNVDVDPQKIDVNVHPTKAEIKIEQMKEVSQAVFDAVREALRKNDLLPVMDLAQEQQMTFGASIRKEEPKKEYKYVFDASEQQVFAVKEEANHGYVAEQNNHEEAIISSGSDSDKIPPFRLLGQIHKTFFVAETVGGVLFIDQHVVQERVLYEKFMEQLMNHRVVVQNLLQGEILELTSSQRLLVKDNLDKLREFGFYLEEFGENSFVLRSIPEVFGRLQPKELLFEIISGLGSNRLEEIQEERITRMACRASVKAGDTLTIAEMQNLLNQLNQTKFPYTCPHGRAVLIKIPVEELEKKFRRK
jgi:DNA mismatch repair protein MutL